MKKEAMQPLVRFGNKISIFLEAIKFEHSIFALPFAYLGLVLAENGMPRGFLLGWVTVAMVSFRTMAMAANRLLDQKIDAANPRTRQRALPAGKLGRKFVWLASLVSFLIFEWSAYRLGPLCFKLSLIPVFLAWLYPLLKRFTWLSHAVLGMILGIAPYGAWLASRHEFSWIPALITLGVLAWVAGFDMIYALQDLEFDREFGLRSFPAVFGREVTLKATRLLHVITLAAWFWAGRMSGLGLIYTGGLLFAALFLVREHWLVRSFGLAKMQEAFFTMNAVVSLSVFFFAVLALALRELPL